MVERDGRPVLRHHGFDGLFARWSRLCEQRGRGRGQAPAEKTAAVHTASLTPCAEIRAKPGAVHPGRICQTLTNWTRSISDSKDSRPADLSESDKIKEMSGRR